MGTVRWLRLGAALTMLMGAYALVPASAEVHVGSVGRLALAVLLLLGATAVMVRQLRLSVRDGDRRIDGLVLAVVTATVAFALLFFLLEVRQPGQFVGLDTRLDALYFTVTTMLTVGFGDVHAQGQVARGLVLVQMVFNVVFVAAAAGLLSARVRRAAHARSPAREDPGAGPTEAR